MSYCIPTDGYLHRGDDGEDVRTLRQLLAQLERDTSDEHLDRRHRLSDAIRGVLAKHARI